MPFTNNTRVIQPGLLLAFLFSSFLAQAQDSGHWQQVASQIEASITEAEQRYAAGKVKEARGTVVQAYLSQFEDSKMEAAMRMELGAKHTWRVEKSFGQLRKATKNGASAKEVGTLAEAIGANIAANAKKLDAAGITAQVFGGKNRGRRFSSGHPGTFQQG